MKEFCVAKEAVAADGPTPEPGDPVTVEMTGNVARIEGDRIYLTDVATNGVPVPAAPEVAKTPLEEDEEIRGMARAADREDSL